MRPTKGQRTQIQGLKKKIGLTVNTEHLKEKCTTDKNVNTEYVKEKCTTDKTINNKS